jgi:hypothetical protein
VLNGLEHEAVEFEGVLLLSVMQCPRMQLTPALQTLDVIFNFDDGSDEVTCAAFNPLNPCLFAFADVSGNVGVRALDRALDAGLVGTAQADIAVNCMGEGR